MEREADSEEDPNSEIALLDKKERRELKRINATKEKAHKRLEAVLGVASENEKPEPETNLQKERKKKRLRTKTAEPGLQKLKKTPPKIKQRSKSEENLLSAENYGVGRSLVQKSKKKKEKDKEEMKKRNMKDQKSDPLSDDDNNELENKNNTDGGLTDDVQIPIQPENFDAPEEFVIHQWEQSEGSGQKKKRKKKKSQMGERVENALQKKRNDDGLFLCIVIHIADQIKPDARVHHPLIRVHLVNMVTGEYIKKTDQARNVTSIFENRNGEKNIDYILPLLTQPYDFKTKRSLTPQWEEPLVYNEIYSYFLQREPDDPPVIIFFELLDFVQMNLKQKDFAKTDKGWYRIAWAFLKVVSPTGSTNTDRQVRLQFYQPMRRLRVQKEENSTLEIFHWWKYGQRVKYPSTLYVTVKGVTPPEKLPPSKRSMFPTQIERGNLDYDDLSSAVEDNTGPTRVHDETGPMWTRLPGQSNRVPNKLYLNLPTDKKGCSYLQFSENGRYLACACATNNSYPILIYEYPEGNLIFKFENHFGIVYDLCWSTNGKELLSGSADSTVRCWDVKRFGSQPIKLFPHPAFVYVCKYHPLLQSIVITGGYDHIIRIWNKVTDNLQADLLRELSDHTGFVNSISFHQDGGQFFSADSAGVILEWSSLSEKGKKNDVKEIVNRWQLVNVIKVTEIKNTTLSTILIHPSGNKLLIQSRDSMLRMLDLRSYSILKSYSGGMNFKEHIHAAFSTCGSFIFCGTEYGKVLVWSTETGNLVHSYDELNFSKAVSNVSFHPEDNYVAFSCFGEGHPVVIYSYDLKVNAENVQIPLMQNNSLNATLDNASETFRSLHTATMISNDEGRIAQIQEKLIGVTAQSTKNRVTFKDPSPRKDLTFDPEHSLLSTWGSDFTYTSQASPSLLRSHQYKPTKVYDNVSSTPKSGHGKSGSPLTMPQLASSPKEKNSEKKRREGKSTKVIAMYDFHSVEEPNQLTFNADDVITIINKTNTDWWFGQLKDGKQGYFPVTYVMQDFIDTNNISKSEGNMSTNYSAAINQRGDLKFLSGNEESDLTLPSGQLRSHKKRRQQGRRINHEDMDSIA